jgi:hypothetical protein
LTEHINIIFASNIIKMKAIVIVLLVGISLSYNPGAAVSYARSHCNNYNPAYNNYKGRGGDCANFVSQCLVLGGGHEKLKGGHPCRGYPCGFEEIGAKNLGDCLQKKGWTSTCGYHQEPPSNIQIGDVLIYHSGGCSSSSAHATLVTQAGSQPKITCHSSIQVNTPYTYMANSKPYYQWLHKN